MGRRSLGGHCASSIRQPRPAAGRLYATEGGHRLCEKAQPSAVVSSVPDHIGGSACGLLAGIETMGNSRQAASPASVDAHFPDTRRLTKNMPTGTRRGQAVGLVAATSSVAAASGQWETRRSTKRSGRGTP